MAINRNEFFRQNQPQQIDPNLSPEEKFERLNEAYIELWRLYVELRDIVEEHDEIIEPTYEDQ